MKSPRRLVQICVSLLAIAALVGCSYMAVPSGPGTQAIESRTQVSLQADELFWKVLHEGRYEEIPVVLEALNAAYLADPNDAVTAAHIGWMHIWRLAEGSRLDRPSPTMINDSAVLARRYFQKAVELNPHEPRYLGFLGATTMTEGRIHNDPTLARRGYAIKRDAIKAWPEFNLFTAGYGASAHPVESKFFTEALEWQWRTLELCTGSKINRTNPDVGSYAALATSEGPKRVCWNSWIAPHNYEGFFLNMGDMLVKSGDWRTAQKIYAAAKQSPTYAQWKFRDVLEARIANAEANVAVFRTSAKNPDPSQPRMMISSSFACIACHQM